MEVKSTEWRPGPTVCRCCLSEGCYKDISTEYFWMGKREVYAEMLSETFDVTIGFSKSGGPNSNSRLICEPCISRLRDASEFKRQVLECEKTFMQHLDPGTSTSADLDITVDMDKEVKLERVKTEKRLSDDDFDDRVGFDDDDDDDDLDDEPLTKLASKVPKKESVDLLDLLDNAKVAEKRKSTAKTKSTPAKKSKKETIRPTPSKSVKIEKKKKDDEQIIARRNAEIVVKYTTAYPFRVPENSMLCVYCCETIEDPSLYRQHMEEVHKSFEIKMAFYHCNEGCIKVDCTDLRCRVCSKPYGNLDAICKHLYNDHGFKVNLKIPPALQPFKLEKDKMLCGICNVQGHSLRQLGRHMASHFLKFMCEECGKSYSTVTTLKQHVTFRHIKDERICRKCKKTFSSMEAKRKHLDETQRCRQYVCGECGDRFITDVAKQHHRKEVHGMIKTYSCRICKENFDDNRKCYRHYMMLHSEDKYICSTCAKTFKYKNDLERHMNIHTKDRAFACTICSKAFSRKTVLDQHMWIHSEQKRFQCALCKKQFNQKVSLKTHMKSHHPEMVDCV